MINMRKSRHSKHIFFFIWPSMAHRLFCGRRPWQICDGHRERGYCLCHQLRFASKLLHLLWHLLYGAAFIFDVLVAALLLFFFSASSSVLLISTVISVIFFFVCVFSGVTQIPTKKSSNRYTTTFSLILNVAVVMDSLRPSVFIAFVSHHITSTPKEKERERGK